MSCKVIYFAIIALFTLNFPTKKTAYKGLNLSSSGFYTEHRFKVRE